MRYNLRTLFLFTTLTCLIAGLWKTIGMALMQLPDIQRDPPDSFGDYVLLWGAGPPLVVAGLLVIFAGIATFFCAIWCAASRLDKRLAVRLRWLRLRAYRLQHPGTEELNAKAS